MVAPCTSVSPSRGISSTSSAAKFEHEAHVPACCLVTMTHWPSFKSLTPCPTAVISAKPSLPATKTGCSLLPLPEEANVVLGYGFLGYTPSMTLRSAGFIGHKRNLTLTVLGAGGGKDGYDIDERTEMGFPVSV